MATIPATAPVTVPGTAQVVYNQWYMTQMILKATPTSCPVIVHLHRSTTDTNGNILLMPNGPGAEISFSVDVFQQMTAFPAMETAMNSIVAAVVAYATAKNLL